MNARTEVGDPELPSPVPTRSRLYGLEPLGRGTSLVEGMASYVDRLAQAHGVPPWMLVVREIAPRFRRNTVVTSGGHCDLFGNMGASIHGNSATAGEMVDVMASLTGRSDLAVLTFRGLSGVLAEGRLIRTVQAWCPACLKGWRECGQGVYRPLIWNLADLRSCPVHGAALQTKCPSCGKHHQPLTRYPWNGHCPKCRGWLGEAKSPNHPTAESEWCLHVAAEVAQCVSTYAARPEFASVGAFSTSIRQAVEGYGWGGLSALGRVVGVDHGTVRDWAAGSQVPSMASVLAMAFCFGVPVTEWLSRPVAFDLREPVRRLPSHDSIPLRRRLRHWKVDELRVRLAEARAQVTYPPPTLSALCKQLGIHVSQATRRVPELAKEIVEHHRFYRRTRQEMGDQFRRMLVESAVNQLLNEGRSLSHTQMAKVLPDGLTLRDRRVRRLFVEYRARAEREMAEAARQIDSGNCEPAGDGEACAGPTSPLAIASVEATA